MYFQKLTISQLEDDTKHDESDDLSDDELDARNGEDMALVELWVLADKLRMPRLQNVVINTIDAIEIKTNAKNIGCYHYIYENTAPGSKLRQYAAEVSAYGIRSSTFKDHSEDFPHKMLTDMMIHISKQFHLRPCSNDLTSYHVSLDDKSKK
jgi:hypothetical protein